MVNARSSTIDSDTGGASQRVSAGSGSDGEGVRILRGISEGEGDVGGRARCGVPSTPRRHIALSRVHVKIRANKPKTILFLSKQKNKNKKPPNPYS